VNAPTHRSLLLALLLATACQGQPAVNTTPIEFLHAPITSLQQDGNGNTWVGFGPMARAFRIPAGAHDLLAAARAAQANGQPVFATVRAGHGDKAAGWNASVGDAGNTDVLRIATTPDPLAVTTPR